MITKSSIPTRAQLTLPLHCAGFDCDLEQLEQLTAEGADVNQLDEAGVSTLAAVIASQNSQRLKAAQWLLERGANVNLAGRNGDSATHLAARMGDCEMLGVLCDHGARIAQQNDQHQSALTVACSTGQWQAAELLLEQGAEANPERGGQPLQEVAMGARDEVQGVDLLLRHGADVNQRSRLGRTALMAAAMRGNSNIAEALLKAGAQVNARDAFGNTALMEAARCGANEFLERLVFWNPDTEYRDKPGRTALLVAVSSTRANAETVRLLISMGAKVEVRNRDGRLAGDLAAAAGRWRIADALGVRGSGSAAASGSGQAAKVGPHRTEETVVIELNSFETREDQDWAARQIKIAMARGRPTIAPPPDLSAIDDTPPQLQEVNAPEAAADAAPAAPEPAPAPDPTATPLATEPEAARDSAAATVSQISSAASSPQDPQQEMPEKAPPEESQPLAADSQGAPAAQSNAGAESATRQPGAEAEPEGEPDDQLPPIFELVPPADVAPPPADASSGDPDDDDRRQTGNEPAALLDESDYQARLDELANAAPDLGPALDADNQAEESAHGTPEEAAADFEVEPEIAGIVPRAPAPAVEPAVDGASGATAGRQQDEVEAPGPEAASDETSTEAADVEPAQQDAVDEVPEPGEESIGEESIGNGPQPADVLAQDGAESSQRGEPGPTAAEATPEVAAATPEATEVTSVETEEADADAGPAGLESEVDSDQGEVDETGAVSGSDQAASDGNADPAVLAQDGEPQDARPAGSDDHTATPVQEADDELAEPAASDEADLTEIVDLEESPPAAAEAGDAADTDIEEPESADDPGLTAAVDIGDGDVDAVDADRAGIYADLDANARDLAGYTGLMEAVLKDDTEQMNVILLSQPDAPQWWLAEAFVESVHNGSAIVPRWLLDNGLEAGACNREGQPLLETLCRITPPPCEMAELLLGNGARPIGQELLWLCGRTDTPAKPADSGDDEDERVTLIGNLLDLGADPDLRDGLGRTALHWAAMRRDKRSIALLLQREAAVNQTDDGGNTPLMLALDSDRPARLGVMRALIQGGADAHLTNHEGVSPISVAMAGDDSTVQNLLMRGAARPAEETATTPAQGDLVKAAAKGNLGRVKRLLARKVDVNEADSTHCTALLRAAGEGHANIVSALLMAGADPDVSAPNGTSVLGAAVLGNHPEVVKMLVDRGVDVDQRQQQGITPLMLAAARWQPRMVRTLITLGADVKAQDETCTSAMMAAVQNALHSADAAAGEKTVRELIKAGADVNEVNDEGQTAMMLLLGARAGDATEVSAQSIATLNEILIDQGAKLDIQDMAGWTALHAAAARGLLSPAQSLLAAGANKRLRDINGLSPCDLAMNHSHDKLVDLFIAS